jgi:hypothetical protein
MLWLALPQFAIAFGAVICSKSVRADRTYHPMLKVIFAALAFVFAGGGVNSLGRWTGQPVTRAIFVLVMLLAVGYAAWFIRRRNITARFIRLLLNGEYVIMSVEELDHAASLAESWANHGTMTPARVASLEAALGNWHRKRAAYDQTQRQIAERRARRGASPGGAGEDE